MKNSACLYPKTLFSLSTIKQSKCLFLTALSTTPTTTVKTTTPGLVKDFVWTLVNVKQRVIVSHEWEMVILGSPSVDKSGVILDSNDKFIRVRIEIRAKRNKKVGRGLAL